MEWINLKVLMVLIVVGHLMFACIDWLTTFQVLFFCICYYFNFYQFWIHLIQLQYAFCQWNVSWDLLSLPLWSLFNQSSTWLTNVTIPTWFFGTINMINYILFMFFFDVIFNLEDRIVYEQYLKNDSLLFGVYHVTRTSIHGSVKYTVNQILSKFVLC